ncbi:hypothetical protein [Georgenia sp. SYP-B2076]|uniref:hypothetical protein n=1 Tax=Georgenia sp. SYP-B2076 TaxID=2495881 RepID=UPI000F8D575E|nr:hypothetical protein [Georgenia sp. SYP-B2076]
MRVSWGGDAEETVQVALRGEDPAVVGHVRRLTDLAGVGLTVVAPDQPMPHCVVALRHVAGTYGAPAERLEVRVDAGRLAEMPDGAAVPGAVDLPGDSGVLLDLLVATAVRHRARTVGVVGAHGGAGASVLAAALARVSVAGGAATALVDLDPAGGGLDVLLGIEHDPGKRWADLREEQGAFLPERLALALPDWHLVRVLSGDRRGGTGPVGLLARSTVRALGQGHDVVVLDLPRQVLAPGPAQELWLTWCPDVVVVGRDGVRGKAALVAAAPALARTRAHLVVRGDDAGELAEAAGMTLVARMRDERALPAGIEHGVAPGDQRRGHLVATARVLLERLGLGA